MPAVAFDQAMQQPWIFPGKAPVESPGRFVAAQHRPVQGFAAIGRSLSCHMAQQTAAEPAVARPAFDIKIA